MYFLSYRLTANLVVEKNLYECISSYYNMKKKIIIYMSAGKLKGGKVSQDKYGYI